MAKNWRKVRDGIVAEYESICTKAPDDVLKVFKYDMIDSRAGSFGTALTTQVFAAGEIRYLATYGPVKIVYAADDPVGYTLDQLKAFYKILICNSPEFAAYCGFKSVYHWDREIVACFDTVETVQDLKDLLSAYGQLLAAIDGWILFYFPWNEGDCRRQRSHGDIKEMAKLAGI